MKRYSTIAIAAILWPFTIAIAQKEGNIWHFGQGAALDFNSGTAVITTPSSMWTFEGSASIADANGNLLFYSNGGGRDPILSGQPSGQIWNRNHQLMYDMGNTEGGGFSSAQSSVIVPKPGMPGNYYLFTMEEQEFDVGGSVPGQPEGRGLSYFDIDMALNAGLGGVASYTPMIYVPTYEGLCAVRHANGSDYWILVHQSDGLGIAVFPVTASGVGTPSFYAIPNGSSSIIKGSPDGKWVSSASSVGGQNLYRFDPASGVLSDPLLLSSQAQSAEFSPDGKRLFLITDDKKVVYYDLTSADINASLNTVATLPGIAVLYAQMQLAPDGEIYFIQAAFGNQAVSLSSIVCPNGNPFLNLDKFAFPAGNDAIFFGLPNFDNAIFRKDGSPPLPVDLGPDLTLCAGESVVLSTGINSATYQWSNGSTNDTLLVANPGTYAVTVTAAGCGIGVDTIEIKKAGTVAADAGEDLVVCKGAQIPLNGLGTGVFTWSPAALVSNPNIANPNFSGNASTTLVLTVTEDGCTSQDTLQITVNENPIASAMPADTTILAGESVQIIGAGVGTVTWSPAAGLSCTDCLNPVATPQDSTVYVLTITNDAGCTDTAQVVLRVTPPDCEPKVPNAFTPNGDGSNDVFRPIGEAIESFELRVYNRWGQEVFKGNSSWDGRIGGQDASSDVYAYRMTIRLCGEEKPSGGEVTLLR